MAKNLSSDGYIGDGYSVHCTKKLAAGALQLESYLLTLDMEADADDRAVTLPGVGDDTYANLVVDGIQEGFDNEDAFAAGEECDNERDAEYEPPFQAGSEGGAGARAAPDRLRARSRGPPRRSPPPGSVP